MSKFTKTNKKITFNQPKENIKILIMKTKLLKK